MSRVINGLLRLGARVFHGDNAPIHVSGHGAQDDLRTFLLNEQIVDQFIQLNMPKGCVHIDGEFAELPGKRAIVLKEALQAKPANFYTRGEQWDGDFVDEECEPVFGAYVDSRIGPDKLRKR